MLSKIFYHNIIEDSELVKRMLMLYLGIINDLNLEEDYQRHVQSLISKAKGDMQEEAKFEFAKVYERPTQELAVMFNQYSRKFDSKQMVCAYRTTGGYEMTKADVIRAFTYNRLAYCSALLKDISCELVSITGIA